MYKYAIPMLAIAAGMGSTAQAADFEVNDRTTVGVFGAFEPYVATEKDANGDSESVFADNGSIVGFSVEQRVGNGVTLFGVTEFEFQSDKSANDFDTDVAFIGAEGGFGRVQLGTFDNVYEDIIIDATEVAELAEITDEAVSGEDNQFAYYSPDFNGFSFRAQARFIGEGDGLNTTGSSGTGLAVAGGYTAQNWGLYAGYDDRGAEVGDEFDANGNVIGQDYSDEGTFALVGTYAIGPVEFAAKHAVQDRADNDPRGDDTTYTALRGTFGYGDGEVHAAVQNVVDDNDNAFDDSDRTEFTAGVAHELYENFTLWAEAGYFDRQNDAGDIAGVGAIYEF